MRIILALALALLAVCVDGESPPSSFLLPLFVPAFATVHFFEMD
jgi:hypothetical protein